MAHRATGSAEDAVGTDWKFGIRKENIFFYPLAFKTRWLASVVLVVKGSLRRAKSSAPWTTPGDRREPSGYEGKGVEESRDENCSRGLKRRQDFSVSYFRNRMKL